VSASPLPETYARQDWPRLVARKVNGIEVRLSAVEAGGVSVSGGSFSIDDGSSSGGGSFSFDDGGA
jgi:uncharacterized membrane protein YgcG